MRLAHAMLLLLILPGLLLPAGITVRVCTCLLEGGDWSSAITFEKADAGCCCDSFPLPDLPVASGDDSCSCCVRIALPADDGEPKLPAERALEVAAPDSLPNGTRLIAGFDGAAYGDATTAPPRVSPLSPGEFTGAAQPLRI